MNSNTKEPLPKKHRAWQLLRSGFHKPNGALQSMRNEIHMRLLTFCCLPLLAITLLAQTPTNSPPQSSIPASAYDQLISAGNARLKADDFTEAHQDAMKAIGLDGNRFEGYALESLTLFKEGKTDQAKEFIEIALGKVPPTKKPQLEKLAAVIEGNNAGTPAINLPGNTPSSAPSEADKLKGDDRLEYETLLSMLSDADKATDLDARHKLLGDFMDRSGRFLKAHPDITHLWVARAAVAVELDQPDVGWEAGQKLKALGMENSNDLGTEKVMIELNEKGWLASKPPEPTPKGKTPDGDPQMVMPQKGYYYTIAPGNTLKAIVKAYRRQGINVTVNDVLKANPGMNPNALSVGMKIFIPVPQR